MNKESILYGIIGLLAGLIIGFVAANKMNQSGMQTASNPAGVNPAMANSNMPADHPPVNPQQNAAMMQEVNAAVEAANGQPNSFEAQMRAASGLYQTQNFDKAVEYYLKANKIKPDDYDAIVQLGNANFDGQHYEEAQRWYSMALTKKPDDISVRTDLGLTFVFRNPPDYDKAITEFQGSLQRNPNHKQTLQNITYAFIQKGDTQKAKEHLDKLEKVDPNNGAIADLRSQLEKKTGKS